MKVLGISGSPRSGGNTEMLVKSVSYTHLTLPTTPYV